LFSRSEALGNIQLPSFSLLVKPHVQYSYPRSAELGYLSVSVFSPTAALPWQKSHRSIKGPPICSLGSICNTGVVKYPGVVFPLLSVFTRSWRQKSRGREETAIHCMAKRGTLLPVVKWLREKSDFANALSDCICMLYNWYSGKMEKKRKQQKQFHY